MQKITSIFILLFALFFCFKDFIPQLISEFGSGSFIIELNEESSEEEDEKEEKKEKDESQIHTFQKLLLPIYNESQSLNILFFTESMFIAPYFEINSPPPERV